MNSTTPFRLVLLPLFAAAMFSAESADETAWRVGVARAVITPPFPVPMAGYAARIIPHRSVLQDLQVKALALTHAGGGRGLILTADIIGFRENVAESICRRITSASGLQRSAILLNASHTHSGPQPFLPSPNTPVAPRNQAMVDYARWLEDRVVETALAALGQSKPAHLDYAAGLVDFPVNRREYTAKGVVLGFNPRGLVDRSVPILRVASPDGRTLCLLFGASCHPTTMPRDSLEICGDYPGFAQAQLEEGLNGVQAMFMQGCAGDTSPYPTGELKHARQHGAELANEVHRVLHTVKFRPIRGPLNIQLGQTNLPLEATPTFEQAKAMANDRESWKQLAGAQLLAQYQEGASPPSHYRAPLALWQFGSDLTLVGLPGEPVSDYLTGVEQALGPTKLWIAGYCNDTCGYLPSPRLLREGGYETRGLYTGRRFAPEVMATLLFDLRLIAQKAGRTIPEQYPSP